MRVTKREMALYYAVVRANEEFGMAPEVDARDYIPHSTPLERISYKRLRACLEAELDAWRLGVKYALFDAAASERDAVARQLRQADGWKREALRSRGEIKNLRMIMGLDS